MMEYVVNFKELRDRMGFSQNEIIIDVDVDLLKNKACIILKTEYISEMEKREAKKEFEAKKGKERKKKEGYFPVGVP